MAVLSLEDYESDVPLKSGHITFLLIMAIMFTDYFH